MKRIHTMLVSAAILAVPVAALATPTIAFYRDGPVRHIEAGQTEQDVQSRMGTPMSTRQISGETHYYYRVEDNFGERATLDVAFDRDGYVIRKGELRTLN
jgi:outer membrane protein assembly factor BamE (lipoprotein component of BamABCDE complex)